MKRNLLVLVPLVAVLSAPGAAAGQVVWEAPPLIRPGASGGLSVLLFEGHPGDELGAMVQWRQAPVPLGVGLRAGISEDRAGDLAAMIGIDISGPLSTLDGDGEVIWWGGAGLGVGDELVASFPFGVVLGWNFTGNGVIFSPYLGAHMVLDVITGPGDDIDLDGSFDLGLDLGFQSGFQARFGASVGGRDAFAIGVKLPTG